MSPDGENLDLVIAYNDNIPYGFADESTRDWRNVRDRSISRVRFVLAHNSEDLTPAIVTLERHASSKCDDIKGDRRRNKLSGAQTLGEVIHLPNSGCGNAATFVHPFDLLREVISRASLRHRSVQRVQSGRRHQVGMGRDRSIGKYNLRGRLGAFLSNKRDTHRFAFFCIDVPGVYRIPTRPRSLRQPDGVLRMLPALR